MENACPMTESADTKYCVATAVKLGNTITTRAKDLFNYFTSKLNKQLAQQCDHFHCSFFWVAAGKVRRITTGLSKPWKELCWAEHAVHMPSFIHHVLFLTDRHWWVCQCCHFWPMDCRGTETTARPPPVRCSAGRWPPPASSSNRILSRLRLKDNTETSSFFCHGPGCRWSQWRSHSQATLPDCEAWISRHLCVGRQVLAAKRTNCQDCSPTHFWHPLVGLLLCFNDFHQSCSSDLEVEDGWVSC